MDAVRVRFAPSPTGHLHIGGARTALFNWLFARHHGGAFVLRIEDTDQERSTPESASGILQALRWLGLDWDEGPEKGGPFGSYYQSERRPLYREAVAGLLEREEAYRCYCTPEELDRRRREAMAAKLPPRYSGQCRRLTPEQRAALEGEGRTAAVRLKVPEGDTAWEDLVSGPVAWRNEEMGDFVILKGDGFPTYNLAVVVDDASMRISHVIRGDDHISNTPRQILLYRALGLPVPSFAHVPMILGEDGKRLSKRHGATWVGEYREAGYLPEALVNYLALLGWSTPESRQTFTLTDLVAEFDLSRVRKAAVMFDPQKLRWLNEHHYLQLSPAERVARLLPFWEKEGIDAASRDREWLARVVEVVGDRVKTLPDIIPNTEFFFREVVPGEGELKVLRKAEKVLPVLLRIVERLERLDHFERGAIEGVIHGEAEAAEVGVGKTNQPLRVAVMGRKVGPGLYESLELLGREESVTRLKKTFPGAAP